MYKLGRRDEKEFLTHTEESGVSVKDWKNPLDTQLDKLLSLVIIFTSTVVTDTYMEIIPPIVWFPRNIFFYEISGSNTPSHLHYLMKYLPGWLRWKKVWEFNWKSQSFEASFNGILNHLFPGNKGEIKWANFWVKMQQIFQISVTRKLNVWSKQPQI